MINNNLLINNNNESLSEKPEAEVGSMVTSCWRWTVEQENRSGSLESHPLQASPVLSFEVYSSKHVTFPIVKCERIFMQMCTLEQSWSAVLSMRLLPTETQ